MAPEQLIESIRQKFPNVVTASEVNAGFATVYAKKQGIKGLCASLKSDSALGFNILMDLFAVDYSQWDEKEARFEVVYNLYSLKHAHRLFVKVAVAEEDPTVDSVVSVWPAANWFERETWDMMGIRFSGHPDLRRILMYEGFEGHALRKDYPFNKRQPLVGPLN
jgi:NADH-quinone oxidoreductase subunit C